MLIDTNVWSELSKPRPDAIVVAWMRTHVDACVLSCIVLAEIRYGIALSQDERQRIRLTAFHDDVHERLKDRIAPFDDAAASAWGPLRAALKRSDTLIGERDMFIAAQALSLGIPLVTRNVAEMQRTGVTVIDPWAP